MYDKYRQSGIAMITTRKPRISSFCIIIPYSIVICDTLLCWKYTGMHLKKPMRPVFWG